MTGRRLLHYQIGEKLGSGGMGEVYRAKDTRLGRDVALKVLPADKVASPERLRRFTREARAASQLNHPNIITIHDIAEAEGIHFIVMEYVPGPTLGHSIPPKGMAPETALRYAVQISSALAKAHGARITHRDLKPANIMLNEEGVVKVLDFGLAKLDEPGGLGDSLTAAETQAGAILGTASYMAPEQAAGQAADARSDIFSFGVILYEMLCGQRPFAGADAVSVMAAILNQEPRPLREMAPRLAEELERIVMRCLRKDPARRFQTMADLKVELEDAAAVRPGAAEKVPSIAVLPFANMSAETDNDYFSDGLAEEIISALTQAPGLKVTARASAFWFRGKDLEITEIGQRLNVEHVLEGSVRKVGSRIRITAQLIKVADRFQLWSERYDREMTDVFAVQDEIAQAIVEKLKVKLSGAEIAPSQRRHSQSLEAYNAYLKGRYYLRKATVEALARSKESFEAAIALDPGYALAYCGLAQRHFFLASMGFANSRELLPAAKSLLERSLHLDGTLADARALLGAIRGLYEFDWRAAGREFQQALACESASTDVYEWYGRWFLLPQWRIEEALAVLERGQQLDPLEPLLAYRRAQVLLFSGQYDLALECCRKALELDPDYWLLYLGIGWVCLGMGKPEEAMAAFEVARRRQPQSPWVLAGIASCLALTGKKEEAREVVHGCSDPASRPASTMLPMAFAHYYLGDLDRMFELAEQAIEQRDVNSFRLASSFFHSLRPDPRYQALLRKLNLELGK